MPPSSFLTRALLRCIPAVGALVLAGMSCAGELMPPSTEEVQEAYARFLTGVVGKLEAAGAPAKTSAERQAQISVFARRMRTRGCDERMDIWADPFASSDAAPPVVFHCTWESGERISLTRSTNTGAWSVSDDATAAAGAGVLLVGPKVEPPAVVAVPVVPTVPKAEQPPPAAPAPATASFVTPIRADAGGSLQAMPSPYVPPTRSERATPLPVPAAALPSPGPMPAPYAPR